jgi:hypothetical protein
MMERKTTKLLACYLAVAIFTIGFVQNVFAGFTPSEVINLAGVDRAEDLQKIRSALELKMVSERLKQLGFTTEEIGSKLVTLSDDQLHRIAIQIDELRVGGSLGAVAAVVFVVCFIYAIVFVILLALGKHP